MLKIDAEGMKKGLQLALLEECETLTNWLWMQVQGEAPPEVDRSQLFQKVTAMGDEVIGIVSAGGIGALTTEWGSGSLADTSNPAWDEYTHSEYWNPYRDPGKHTIRTREAGPYKNLDSETVESKAKRPGINVEWKYPPVAPQHWMRKIITMSRPFIMHRLADMARMFPYHRYIHFDGR